jgi:hypothetical protein
MFKGGNKKSSTISYELLVVRTARLTCGGALISDPHWKFTKWENLYLKNCEEITMG